MISRAVIIVFLSLLFFVDVQAKHDAEKSAALVEALPRDTTVTDSARKLFYRNIDMDPILAYQIAKRALEITDSLGYQRGIQQHNYHLAQFYTRMQLFDESIKALQTSLKIATKRDDRASIAWIYNSMGSIYADNDFYTLAEENYLKCNELLIELKSIEADYPLINLASIYRDMNRNEDAEELYNDFLSRLDTTQIKRNAVIYNNFGLLRVEMERYGEAIEFFNEALKYKYALNKPLNISNTFTNLARAHTGIGNYGEAQRWLDSTRAYANWEDGFSYLNEADMAESDLRAAEGDFEAAFDIFQGYHQRTDSFNTATQMQKVEHLLALYAKDQMASQLTIANKDRDLLKNRDQMMWLAIIGLSTLALLMAGFILVNARLMRKLRLAYRKLSLNADKVVDQQKKILIQKERLEEKNVELETAMQERKGMMEFVAHDLKAPFNKILAVLEMLKQDGSLSPAAIRMLHMIESSSESGKDLIQDLLLISETEDCMATLCTQNVNIDLYQFVVQRIDSFRAASSKKQITLELDYALPFNHVPTDPKEFGRILDNLISNAIKFSPKGKAVVIGVKLEENIPVVFVKDEGPGISEEDQRKMWQKFSKLSARPTGGESSHGLGLAIVKSLADRMGGEIHLQSELGKGATFAYRFPSQHTESLV